MKKRAELYTPHTSSPLNKPQEGQSTHRQNEHSHRCAGGDAPHLPAPSLPMTIYDLRSDCTMPLLLLMLTDGRSWFGAAAPSVAPVRMPRAVLSNAAAELYGPFREAPAALQPQMRRHLPKEGKRSGVGERGD